MIIKLITSLFILFAASRVYLRYKDGAVGRFGISFWLILWTGVGVFTWWPNLSDKIANSVGVGRGVDALIYFSIIALFYAVFRIYIKLEFIEREITSLVRNISLKSTTIKKKNNVDVNKD